MRWPLTTSRTAWARRKTRTALVSVSTVSNVGKAVSEKWSVSVRIGGLFYINYYENYENNIVGHEILRIPSYWSNLFSTQTFQELLIEHNCGRRRRHRGAVDPPLHQLLGRQVKSGRSIYR